MARVLTRRGYGFYLFLVFLVLRVAMDWYEDELDCLDDPWIES
jgi:hypothetical protein